MLMTSFDHTIGTHPLQNRVDPYGRLIQTSARGAWMGNRGLIHNEYQKIVRPFRLKAWITCKLEFKNWHRVVMTPGRYTELFFQDEATSFSAGHRPCAECRREDFNRFKAAWVSGNSFYGFNNKTPIAKIDDILHQERMDSNGMKVTYKEQLDLLPEGSFIEHEDKPFLILKSNLLIGWTAFGYQDSIELTKGIEVTVLTPKSIVNTFRAGYLIKHT
jgi:hypothetical protein